MSPEDTLRGVKRVFLDTSPVIYLLENDALFGSQVAEFVKLAAELEVELLASPITLAECLAGAKDEAAKASFIDFLTNTREVAFRNVDHEDAILASDLRQLHRLPPPTAFNSRPQ